MWELGLSCFQDEHEQEDEEGAMGSTGQTTNPPMDEPYLVGRGSCRADRSKIHAARFVAAPRERRPTFLRLHWRDGFRQSDRRTELHPDEERQLRKGGKALP
jgi:hypothetical protein